MPIEFIGCPSSGHIISFFDIRRKVSYRRQDENDKVNQKEN